jgi:signal transduction histidine kinase
MAGVYCRHCAGAFMKVHKWLRPPRHVLAIFVVVAIVSAAALTGLVWLLLQQEKAVEMQRTQERVQQAADHAAAVTQAVLADLDRAPEPPEGVVLVRIAGGNVGVRPGSLLYYPEIPQHTASTEARFAEGEQAEFARNDLKAAAAFYARLIDTQDTSVRAAALTRLARVHRKAKDYEKALQAYDNLSGLVAAAVDDLPSGLVAREGRATIFAETNRAADLKKEADALRHDLRTGRWRITKSQYDFCTAEADAWFGTPAGPSDVDAIARAEAVAWLWQNRQNVPAMSRHLINTGGSAALIVTRTVSDVSVAAIGGPTYLTSLCREAVRDTGLQCSLSDAEGHPFIGQLPTARTSAILTSAATRLPWTLQVSGTPSGAVTTQRRLLLWVAVVLTTVWLTGAVFIIRAIKREARLAQLQSDFVAAVSHEFRSPLSSLCQISEMLSSNRFQSDELRYNAYAVLSRESERLRRLVKGLLDFQRLEAGAEVYQFEPIGIGTLLESIVEDFRATVSDAGYSVELRGAEAGTSVRGDRDALSRAIWNLLDNAVKYSPECPTVWVDIEQREGRVSIAVQDHGLGIPIHEQRDIFEKFVRGAESKARRIKGTGIGLAMVRRIVQAHGGEILLASRPGEGSRFTMVFPLEGRL